MGSEMCIRDRSMGVAAPRSAAARAPLADSAAAALTLTVVAVRGLAARMVGVAIALTLGHARALTCALEMDGAGGARVGSTFRVPARMPAGAGPTFSPAASVAVRLHEVSGGVTTGAAEAVGALIGCCVVPLPALAEDEIDGWFALSPPTAAAAAAAASEAGELARGQASDIQIRLIVRRDLGSTRGGGDGNGGGEARRGTLALGGVVFEDTGLKDDALAGAPAASDAPAPREQPMSDGLWPVVMPRLLFKFSAAVGLRAAPRAAREAAEPARPMVRARELAEPQLRRTLPPTMAAALAEIHARRAHASAPAVEPPPAPAANASAKGTAAAPIVETSVAARLAAAAAPAATTVAVGARNAKVAKPKAETADADGAAAAKAKLKRSKKKVRTALFF